MTTYLDSITPLVAEVGYGTLGVCGHLGYADQRVVVQQRAYEHALSTHPPARLTFDLGGRYKRFHCLVAINDDVPRGLSHADFFVRADGTLMAKAEYVMAGTPPRELVADVRGARVLELEVRTARWCSSHAVWLDAIVDGSEVAAPFPVVDCLGRADVEPVPLPPCERCVATVVAPGFEMWLDDMLGSLVANGGVTGAQLVVFAIAPDTACRRVAARYAAALVPCRPRTTVGMASKAVLYSAAHVVPAQKFICLDADMLVTGPVAPLFDALDVVPAGSVLVCREANRPKYRTLMQSLRELYGGNDADAASLEMTSEERSYPLVINDGLFAGSRDALLAVDGVIRAMPRAIDWLSATNWVWWRNQFAFNLAIARTGAAVELDGAYNVQLQEHEIVVRTPTGPLSAEWAGRPARVLHFNGGAKAKYPEIRGRYARTARALVGPTAGDAYSSFLNALRTWAGVYGLDALSWSFYGTTDGSSADVRDASVFPLLATLHYLIRANGCVRVIESGTARGISTACIASAIAHRPGARVVAYDPCAYTEREHLWALLTPAMRDCIEMRAVDAIEGMKAALRASESYEAALLDSLHTEEHVWAEFQLVRRLVCPGGLILIHDATYALGTVEGALKRIEREGYGVVRLWTAEGGVQEDDRLGLAVIENRRRSDGRHS